MHTRSATLVAVALSLLSSPAPASAQGARAALVKQSDIIFIGTVTQVGAVAVPEVPASDRTIVVRVDQVLEKPAAIALSTGDSVTVQTARPGSLKPGTQATFYTTGWVFGRGVAVREVGHERSEEHTSELQSPCNLVCRLLLEKKKTLGNRTMVVVCLMRWP